MTLADRVVVMNQGRIEHVASPIELYQHPENTSVAAFIGAPSMNFLNGEVIELGEGRGIRLADGTELALDAEKTKLAVDAVGRPVTLGLRPEHIEDGDQGCATIRFAPQAIEPLGPHTLLIGRLNEAPFTAQVDVLFPAEPEQPCTVICDMTKAHLFDRESGRAIRP